MVRVRDWLVLVYGSENGVSVLICPSEPSRERFKVSHVINKCLKMITIDRRKASQLVYPALYIGSHVFFFIV